MAEKLIAPRRNEILSSNGFGTTRLMEFLERTADTGNESTAAIDAQIVQNLSSAVFALQVQIGSGEFLTSDCDSLTVDSDILYVDQTEA